MFTGIIETTAIVSDIVKVGTNFDFWLTSNIVQELKIDQSVAHNGVCLTVVAIENNQYKVTAVNETLTVSNLGNLRVGSSVNIERCMLANGRYDGHIVQGHVDGIATCAEISQNNGSWTFNFVCSHPDFNQLVVHKGSITINGISLTVASVADNGFSVAIIPYTFEHTNLNTLKVGDNVNIEFDILGKYIAKQLAFRQ